MMTVTLSSLCRVPEDGGKCVDGGHDIEGLRITSYLNPFSSFILRNQ
jgi:hypothetical protein